jgi:copper chaperone CopZ
MTTTTYNVVGMTCDHCVAAVTKELTALEGVENVAIVLNVGGQTPVSVTSQAPLADASVAEAIDEAGYELAPATA